MILTQYLQLVRIKSWIKNIFVLFPLFFSLNLNDLNALKKSLLAFIVFSLTSSAIYVLNDIKDIEKDKLHPRKKLRPLPAGAISINLAFILFAFLVISTILIVVFVDDHFFLPLLLYFVLNISYTLYLKTIYLVDIIVLAINFLLRVIVGCLAIQVMPSQWILVITFFIALFLSFIKRKSELIILKENATKHRPVLKDYSIKTLDKFINITASIIILSYLMYTIAPDIQSTFNSKHLSLSVIFVVFGLFRFIQLSDSDIYEGEGDPTTLLFKDKYLQIISFLWAVSLLLLIYIL